MSLATTRKGDFLDQIKVIGSLNLTSNFPTKNEPLNVGPIEHVKKPLRFYPNREELLKISDSQGQKRTIHVCLGDAISFWRRTHSGRDGSGAGGRRKRERIKKGVGCVGF